MTNYKAEFLKLCIDNQILQFGEFVLKSGRISPYFFNAGHFNNGKLLGKLAQSYAAMLSNNLKNEFMLYGPAYKGIPLAASISVQLHQHENRNIAYAFNRKEVKDHGEGGQIVGAELSGDIVIVDDVITAGTSVNESIQIIKSAKARPCAIAIALDRQEVAPGEKQSAVQKVEQTYNIPVLSLLKLNDLIVYLESLPEFQHFHKSIAQYRDQFGST
jgi:orotate phosphoribosyltransferase